MTLLGFKRRFAPAVEARTKKHTIRAPGKNGMCRFTVGYRLQLYTDVRQKSMRKLADVDPVVTKIEQIRIVHQDDPDHRYNVTIGARSLMPTEVGDLSNADGFETISAFLDFFVPGRGDVFAGHIIHWDWL